MQDQDIDKGPAPFGAVRSRTLDIAADLGQLARARELVRDVAAIAGLPNDRAFDMQVAVSEAVANAIEHAESAVSIVAWLLRDRILFEITNDGYFRPGSHKESSERSRGLGMPLMATLADHMHFARLSGNRTRVSLTFMLEPSILESPRTAVPMVTAPEEKATHREPLRQDLRLWSWLPAGLLAVAIVFVGIVSVGAFPPPNSMISSLNGLLCGGSGFAIAYLAARTYGAGRSYSALTMGAGGLVLGLSYFAAGVVIPRAAVAATILVCAMPVAAGLFLATAVLAARDVKVAGDRMIDRYLVLYYSGAITFVGIVAAVARTGVASRILTFGFEANGSAEALIFVGFAVYIGAAIGFALLGRGQRSSFFTWCAAAMGLEALGLGNATVFKVPGELSGWLALVAQYMGGLYLLLAAVSAERIGQETVLPLGRALRLTQARLQALIEVSPNAIWLQAEHRLVFVNPAAVHLFGAASEASLIGRDVLSLVPEESRAGFADWMNATFGGQVSTPYYQTFGPGAGEEQVATEVVGTPVEIEQGPALMVVAHDISDLKIVEQALRESEENFRALADNIPQLAWMADAEGHIFWYNRRWHEFTGLSPDEMQATGWESVQHPEHAQSVAAKMEEAFREGDPWQDTFPLRARDGTYRWFLSLAMPIKDDSGEVVRWFGTNTDITETLEQQRDSEERARLSAASNNIKEIISSSLDYERILQMGVEEINRALGTDFGGIQMEEGDHWVTKYGYGMDETVATRNLTDEDVPLTKLARDTRAIVVIDDVQASDQPDHQVAKSLGIRSMIVIPLLLRGEVMGILVSAHRRHDRPFDANEIAFAESMGKMLSLAVENAGAFATLERDAKYSMALGEVDREIHRSLDVQVIAESALAEGAKALGVELAFLEMREPDSSRIVHVYRWSDNNETPESFEVPPCTMLISEIGATIAVDEAETDPRVDQASWKKWKIRSLAVSPLLVREQNIGSLCFCYVTQAHRFAKEEVDFVTKLASSLALAMENARLYEAQRNIAATLQRMLLFVPTSVPGIRFSQLYRSATQDASVGGDFYDILELEDGSVCLLIGDVSGHGVEAARAATVVRDTIAAFAGGAVDPEVILTRTNEILLRRGMGGFATVLLATVSADRRSLRFCSAGHPNLVVKRASGEVLMVGHDNSPPLGVFSDWSCGLGSIEIDRGDILFFYTDGLTEARNGTELFGEGRLLESIRAKAGVTLDDLPNSILQDVLGFAEGALRDDIAILAVSPSID